MRGSGMLYGSKGFVEVLKHIHHVDEHQAGVLVLVLLDECLETILLIEGNGREVGIDSDVTKSRGTSFINYQHHSICFLASATAS